MKKVYLILSLVLTATFLFGQNLRPVAQKVSDRKMQNAKFSSAQIFTVSNATRQQSTAIAGTVSNAVIMEFDHIAAQNLVSLRSENLNFIIPSGGNNIELELFQSNIFTPDFTVITASNNLPVNYNGGVHYWGIIKGDNASIAAISIFNDEVMGMISSSSIGNLVLGRMQNDNTGRHILYNMKDLKGVKPLECFIDDNASPSKDRQTPSERVLANCIRLYWEVNYDIFQNKGSVANATNYVTGLFNQSAILYTNDAIPVMLSQVFVWDTPSPYTQTSTSGLLGQFQTTRNSFNGDFGHLLGFAGGGGVAASIGSLCSSSTDSRQCYSGINSSYTNVPAYGWSVEVVTHEQGHLMGSHHTHWCGWIGGPIDNCNTCWSLGTEGGCANGPSVTSGTIMSYCHGCSNGINFNNGFGPQPKGAILDEFNSAGCLMNCTVGCTDNYEPNNTKATAASIPVSTDVSGLISSSGDIDWFLFSNTPNQRNIQITLTSLPANYNVRLFRNGTVVASSLNGGTASETINYNTTLGGTYKIKVFGVSGANDASDCYTLRVALSSTPFRFGNDGTAAEQQNSIPETMFSLQPNPAKESVSLRFNADGVLTYSISVYDLTGRQLMHFENKSAEGINTSELSLEKLYKGIYIVRFEIANQSFTQKLVKE